MTPELFANRDNPLQRVAKPIAAILISGVVAGCLFTEAYLGRISLSIEVLACIAALCIMGIRPRDPLMRLYKLFLLGEFFVLPLWQLATRDSIYLPLLRESNPTVFLWFALNIAGLLVTVLILGSTRDNDVALTQVRVLIRAKSSVYVMALIALAGLAFIYYKLGGYHAVVELYRQRIQSGVQEFDPLNGLGSIQALANTAPLWIFVCLTLRPWKGICIKLANVAQLVALGWLSSGVFGNRQGMLLVLIFSFFLHDQLVKSFSLKEKRSMALCVFFLAIALMPLKFGIDYTNLRKFSQNFEEKRQLHLSMGPLSFLLFRDLSRFDVQLTALSVVTEPAYSLPLGRSFLGAISAIIPRFVWNDRPSTFVEEKTAIVGASESGNSEETTLLFGMPGEMLVNFGIFGYVSSFAVPALMLVFLRKLQRTQNRRWTPLKVVLTPLPFLFFLFDSNVLAYYVMRWILLFALPLTFVLRRD
ncbi:conserved hypothetical protein [Burkholderia sp. H160]|nr:conserved hypothetical protein [Burkholderia sp. H160]